MKHASVLPITIMYKWGTILKEGLLKLSIQIALLLFISLQSEMVTQQILFQADEDDQASF